MYQFHFMHKYFTKNTNIFLYIYLHFFIHVRIMPIVIHMYSGINGFGVLELTSQITSFAERYPEVGMMTSKCICQSWGVSTCWNYRWCWLYIRCVTLFSNLKLWYKEEWLLVDNYIFHLSLLFHHFNFISITPLQYTTIVNTIPKLSGGI